MTTEGTDHASAGTPNSAASSPIGEPGSAIGSVDRAVDVLLLFGRSLQPSLGVTEIAQELGMAKSGVHRILSTLKRRRLVTFDPSTRKYSLGQAAVALSQGYAARHDMQSIATQALTALMQQTQETALLSIRRHGSVIHRAQSVPHHELRIEVHLATPVPLHVGASGKAFLAFLPPDEVHDYVTRASSSDGALTAFTSETVVDVGALETELERIRTTGYATSQGERLAGAAAIAAPVLDHDDYPVSVLAITGPAARLDVADEALISAVATAAERMSREMGYTGA